jgi:hypothetical protein
MLELGVCFLPGRTVVQSWDRSYLAVTPPVGVSSCCLNSEDNHHRSAVDSGRFLDSFFFFSRVHCICIAPCTSRLSRSV